MWKSRDEQYTSGRFPWKIPRKVTAFQRNNAISELAKIF
jgi:hypothetical protein